MSTTNDRSWMYKRVDERGRLSNEFIEGVDLFVDFAIQHPDNNDGDRIRCPCVRCRNLRFFDTDTVKVHLYKKGFKRNYFRWLCHGELVGESSSSTNVSNPYREMVMHHLGGNGERVDFDEMNSFDEEPNVEAKHFLDLLKAAEQPLYDGSKHTVLEVASRLVSLKCEYNLSHRCVDTFASLVNELIPANNNQMGSSFYETMKVLKGLELPHERIHVCPSGCMLFWKENNRLEKCGVCGSDRYKTSKKGTQIPSKVLIYFPLTPRLQRLYATKNISGQMTWHAKNPRKQGVMAHPSDTEAWKHFDRTFPDFACEPRNVRLGLCSDGFSPFGKFGGQYSCWPVIVTPYNLPPSMCMLKQFMFLSLLVPGPKNPKGNLDVYMQPLVEELQHLWSTGTLTYDVSMKQNFVLRAAILWTISDFPAYGMLSGWPTAGKKACPLCMDESKAFWLKHGGKVSWFDCHRQFLHPNHMFRNNKNAFRRNKVERDMPPRLMSGEEIWECVKHLPKATDVSVSSKKPTKGWTKQSILWSLPYWKKLLIRHNLDVMHIEKNFFDQIIHTVMDVKGLTSDTVNARKDIAIICNRKELHIIGDDFMPKAPFTLDKAQKKVLCEWVRDLKFPDGYASNFARCVDLKTSKLRAMKSHDCHVFMERLLPVALKELLPTHVWKAITEISLFFRDLCTSTIKVCDMERLQYNIPEIICKLEKIFPPAFFNSMEHLPVHLPNEAKIGGPVQYRWMYPFERFLNHLKRKVGNKARVEGSICNAYLAEEIATFCSNYFQEGVDTKLRDLPRNVRSALEEEHSVTDEIVPEMFRVDCGRSTTNGRTRYLVDIEYKRAHSYVLANSGILSKYEREFEAQILQTKPNTAVADVWGKYEHEFPDWFQSRVLLDKESEDVVYALAMGPIQKVNTWHQFFVNGFNFHTYDYGKNKATMNYGVCVEGQDEETYYGILEEVVELVYRGHQKAYKTILFKCNWMDNDKGMNIHEQYKLVEVNHTKRYPRYDPFVLSYQAVQVYYAPYPSLKRDKVQWWAVFRTKARSDIDAPVDEDVLQEEGTNVAVTLCHPNEISDYQVEVSNDDDDDEPLVDGFLSDTSTEEPDDVDIVDVDDEDDTDYLTDFDDIEDE